MTLVGAVGGLVQWPLSTTITPVPRVRSHTTANETLALPSAVTISFSEPTLKPHTQALAKDLLFLSGITANIEWERTRAFHRSSTSAHLKRVQRNKITGLSVYDIEHVLFDAGGASALPGSMANPAELKPNKSISTLSSCCRKPPFGPTTDRLAFTCE